MGLTALGREMSTLPKLQYEYGTLYLFYQLMLEKLVNNCGKYRL